MIQGEEPLLAASRDDSSSIDDRQDAEDQALLSGQRKDAEKSRWTAWREIAIFTWAFIATVVIVVLAVLYQRQTVSRPEPSHSIKPIKITGKRNLVFMVSDGMGPASLTLTRNFRQNTTSLPIDDVLVLDQYLIGQSRTRSSSSLITDSAAGATAFSCGKKSYNGAISMLPDHKLCGTVMEAAKRAGYVTGLVVTTRITDATPACFGSHATTRNEEDSIARQLIGEHPLGHVVDLMFGGGQCHFLPHDQSGSCRKDGIDVIQNAKEKGYTYLKSRTEFDGLEGGKSVKLPMLGLFSPTDIPYEIDRRGMADVYPSLDEMTMTALNALKAATVSSEKGFFLMIEGSRIDHAGHGNDPAAQVHEVLAYDKAFSSVLDFLEKDDTDGVVVATSDHETGGLAVARQLHKTYPEYKWFPGVLANASHSGEYLAQELKKYQKDGIRSNRDIESFIRKQIQAGLGVSDVTDTEVETLMQVRENGQQAAYKFADIVSRRAQTGWSTHGHSAVDVNIYSSSPAIAASLVGNHENTEVGSFLAEFLEVDMEAVTENLRNKSSGFTFDSTNASTVPWLGQDMNLSGGTDESLRTYDHYSGDFRKREEVGCGCDMH